MSQVQDAVQPRPRFGEPVWVRLVHGFLDAVVIAFAIWTLLYEVALATEGSARTTLLIWIPLGAVTVAACLWRAVRERPEREAPPASYDTTDPRPGRTGVRRLLDLVVLAAGIAAAAVWVLTEGEHFLWMYPLLAVAAVALALRAFLVRAESAPVSRPTNTAHVVAFVVAVGLAVFTLFLVQGDPDDVYYVNRSVWTAQHDTFPLRDTMFGAEKFPSGYPLPIASVEGLLGAMAALLHVNAAAFSYLGAATFWCFLAAWATWRLVGAWAPRRHLLVFLAAIAVCLFDSRGTLGDFSYARMWTGKVMGMCTMVPLAWVYLTAVAERRGSLRWSLFMLFACGLGFVGMSPTAVIMLPVISAVVVLAALMARRDVGRQVAAAIALSIAPVVAGVAVLFISQGGVGQGAIETAPSSWSAFLRSWGRDPWVVGLLLLAITAGALCARARHPQRLAAAAALATVVLLLPGVSVLLDDYTGAGPLYYRLLLVAPLAVLAGLLLSMRFPGGRHWQPVGAAVTAVALLAVLVVGGTAAWTRPVHGLLVSTPTVDVNPPESWTDAQQVADLGTGQLVLMPPQDMKALAILTTRSFAVVPRKFYVRSLDITEQARQDRLLLMRFAEPGTKITASPERIAKALDRVEVTTVCLFRGQHRRLDVVRQAGYGDRTAAGRLTCLRRGVA